MAQTQTPKNQEDKVKKNFQEVIHGHDLKQDKKTGKYRITLPKFPGEVFEGDTIGQATEKMLAFAEEQSNLNK